MKLPLKAMTYLELLALQRDIEAALRARSASAKNGTTRRTFAVKPSRQSGTSARALQKAA